MTEIPEAFDWVSARAACSAESMLMRLFEVLKSDVERLQTVALPRNIFRVTCTQDSPGKVIVSVVWNYGGFPQNEGVIVELDHGILRFRHVDISRSDTLTMSAHPTVCPDGKCRLVIEGQPLELWQVSKMALEPVFFGN